MFLADVSFLVSKSSLTRLYCINALWICGLIFETLRHYLNCRLENVRCFWEANFFWASPSTDGAVLLEFLNTMFTHCPHSLTLLPSSAPPCRCKLKSWDKSSENLLLHSLRWSSYSPSSVPTGHCWLDMSGWWTILSPVVTLRPRVCNYRATKCF